MHKRGRLENHKHERPRHIQTIQQAQTCTLIARRATHSKVPSQMASRAISTTREATVHKLASALGLQQRRRDPSARTRLSRPNPSQRARAPVEDAQVIDGFGCSSAAGGELKRVVEPAPKISGGMLISARSCSTRAHALPAPCPCTRLWQRCHGSPWQRHAQTAARRSVRVVNCLL